MYHCLFSPSTAGILPAMPYLIGVDEAGYGPNLGPLVVSASVWQIAASSEVDLYERLAGAVVREVDSAGQAIAVADSKTLYKPGGTLEHLERGLLAVLRLTKQPADNWHALWASLHADPHNHRTVLPWYADYHRALPTAVTSNVCDQLAARLEEVCCRTDVRPLAVRSRAVFPDEFNQLTEQLSSKGAALSHIHFVIGC